VLDDSITIFIVLSSWGNVIHAHNISIIHSSHRQLQSYNAGLVLDQKIRTRDMYRNVDKAIRHTISTISSADGNCQQRKPSSHVNQKIKKLP